jgi:N-acetylmuramoyl-L-alanine amidase
VLRPPRTIVLDAGHGGHDPGAVGPTGLREKTVTLEVAKSLRDLLVRDGFRVIMTRYDDRFVSLGGRSAVANREEADLFVSVHANASRRRSISGFEAYYLSEATDDQARALEAAENTALPEEVGRPISSDTEAIIWDLLYTEHRAESLELASDICRGMSGAGIVSRNRGVKSARFAVLKGARMPAVLVEVGFVSHRDEEVRLRRPDYRTRLAEGIRQGILRFRDRLEREYARAR